MRGPRCQVPGVRGLALVGLLCALPVSAQTRDDRYDRFSAAYASLDPDRIAAMYTDDALYLGPAGEIVRGRAAIRERHAGSSEGNSERRHVRRITFDFIDRVDAGDVRNEVGYYTITTSMPGHATTFRGKFVKVWRRASDGVWRIHTDSYSPALRK